MHALSISIEYIFVRGRRKPATERKRERVREQKTFLSSKALTVKAHIIVFNLQLVRNLIFHVENIVYSVRKPPRKKKS